ncbi:MAG: ATP-binding protein [Micavibrio sp.]
MLAFTFSWHEIEEVYDAQLVHSAKVLLQLTEHEILENGRVDIQLGTENPNLQHRYEKKMAFRVWHGEKLVTESANAKAFGNFEATPGFSDQHIQDKLWRFFVFVDADKNLRVETSERYAIRYELIGQLMTSLIIPILLFIPMILTIVWIGVRKSLSPVVRLSYAVDTRHSDDLAPIASTGIPQEILPLVQALNRLFGRISDSFRREREFTDYAAHELRTPLAAMKTQTQVLMKKAAQMPECRDGLDNLHATIDRATHLVEQLLLLARVQNENLELEAMDLSESLRDVIDYSSRLAQSKNQMIKTDIAENVVIKGNPDSLPILIRNILDNALKYTPEAGVINIDLSRDAVLSIKDTGPGLSDEDKGRVFDRFIRADKTGQTGSGLGLSIAQSIAQAHGVSIQLSDNHPRGLIACMKFERVS